MLRQHPAFARASFKDGKPAPSLGLVAHLTRHSDIRGELKRVAELGVAVSVVWAAGDRVVTRACFDDQCNAVGLDGTVVEGNHGWLMADPIAFGRIIAEHLQVQLFS